MSIKYEWDLTSFYQGFDDPDFQRDMAQIAEQYKKTKKIQEEILLKEERNPVFDLKEILNAIYEWKMKYGKLRKYIFLRDILAKNDEEISEKCDIFCGVLRGYDQKVFYQNLDRYLEVIPDLESVLKEDVFLWNNRNFLRQQREELVREASEKDLAVWDTMVKELIELSLNEIIDRPCFLWEGKKVSAYDIYEKKVDVPAELSKEFMQSVYEKVADCLLKNKKAALFYAEMYGFHSVLELVLEEEYMQFQSYSALLDALEGVRPVYDEYINAQQKYERWLEEHWISKQEPTIQNNVDSSKEEEIEYLMCKMAEYFENICPSFVNFIRKITEKGWVDFYERPEKKLTRSQFECFCIEPIRESRITIQGIQGTIPFIDESIAHEYAHAFGAYLGREEDILDEGSGILQEVFPMYVEIVIDRAYGIRRKRFCEWQNNSPLAEELEETDFKWPNIVFEYVNPIACEKKLYAMIRAKETLDEQKISELYNGHDWAFNHMLVEMEYPDVRYFVAAVLALTLDRKVKKQGNVFLQEDMDLWRDVPKLTVEEFVERLTGKECTKQVWTEMVEETLVEPMRRYIKAVECGNTG